MRTLLAPLLLTATNNIRSEDQQILLRETLFKVTGSDHATPLEVLATLLTPTDETATNKLSSLDQVTLAHVAVLQPGFMKVQFIPFEE